MSSDSAKRPGRIIRYKPNNNIQSSQEDLTPDYLNILALICAVCSMMLKIKYGAWLALVFSAISFAHSRVTEDSKQVLSSFMLSFSAVVMSYLQNPAPIFS